jgi:hypothetical protein
MYYLNDNDFKTTFDLMSDDDLIQLLNMIRHAEFNEPNNIQKLLSVIRRFKECNRLRTNVITKLDCILQMPYRKA